MRSRAVLVSILVATLALVAGHTNARCDPASPAATLAKAMASVAPVVVVVPPPRRPKTPPYKVQGMSFAVHESGLLATCASVIDTIDGRHFFPQSSVGVLLPSTAALAEARKSKKAQDLKFLDGVEFVPVKVIDVDRDHDIALLRIVDGRQAIAPLALHGARVDAGTQVVIPCISPRSFHRRMSRGMVGGRLSGLVAAPGKTMEVLTTSMICPTGVMGAPVLHPGTGRVFAVTKAHLRLLGRPLSKVPGLTPDDYCVPVFLPIRYVKEALGRVLPKK